MKPYPRCRANRLSRLGFKIIRRFSSSQQTGWIGCPYRANRSRNDHDGVFYRFFGPDPIPYRESLVFTSMARGDDYESVAFYYQIPDVNAEKPANGDGR